MPVDAHATTTGSRASRGRSAPRCRRGCSSASSSQAWASRRAVRLASRGPSRRRRGCCSAARRRRAARIVAGREQHLSQLPPTGDPQVRDHRWRPDETVYQGTAGAPPGRSSSFRRTAGRRRPYRSSAPDLTGAASLARLRGAEFALTRSRTSARSACRTACRPRPRPRTLWRRCRDLADAIGRPGGNAAVQASSWSVTNWPAASRSTCCRCIPRGLESRERRGAADRPGLQLQPWPATISAAELILVGEDRRRLVVEGRRAGTGAAGQDACRADVLSSATPERPPLPHAGSA